MRIGFYGDSFCENNSEGPWFGIFKEYDSWVDLLAKSYSAEIVNIGSGGSSHWDLIINQFLSNHANLPDICVFTWTDPYRLYHRKLRHIREYEALQYTATKNKLLDPGYDFGFNKKIWEAAEKYYTHLYDKEKTELEYKSSLYYFDNEVLSKLPHIKFVHLWGFGNVIENKETLKEQYDEDNLTYLHSWRNGIEIRPSLMNYVTRYCDDIEKINLAPNHILGKQENINLFEKIRYEMDKAER